MKTIKFDLKKKKKSTARYIHLIEKRKTMSKNFSLKKKPRDTSTQNHCQSPLLPSSGKRKRMGRSESSWTIEKLTNTVYEIMT